MSSPRILVGVGGGIAAFKVATAVSQLVQRGARVRVAMTRSAQDFVGRVTFEGLTGLPAITAPTQIDPDGTAPHIEESRSADILLVAPATAALIARLACGVADDAVTLAAVACRQRRVLCPAMNDAMWNDPTVQRNVEVLRGDGWEILGPVVGHLAEGYAAIGRMVEAEDIVAALLG